MDFPSTNDVILQYNRSTERGQFYFLESDTSSDATSLPPCNAVFHRYDLVFSAAVYKRTTLHGIIAATMSIAGVEGDAPMYKNSMKYDIYLVR